MIEAMDTPEASIASLWEMLTSSPWWKTILITIILIVLFLLFAPCLCNYVIGFVSSRMRLLSYKWLSKLLAMPQPPPNILLGAPGSKPSIRGLGEFVASPI